MEENVDLIQSTSYDVYCDLENVYKHRYLHLKQIKHICVDLWFKRSFESMYQIECNTNFRTEFPLSFGNIQGVAIILLV